MNQAKAMKATLKSSTEKKQPIESTTPNNEVSVERLSAMKKHVFGLGSAQEKVVKLSKQLSHLKSLVSRHPDAVTVVTGIAGCAGLKGPSVQKSFNSWAVTTVVEYFHLLPYAAIL
ncbi:hypothetical protein ACFX13_042690 [Malus domestica]